MSLQEIDAAEARKGMAYGLAAFLIWGILPNFFKLIDHVPAFETLSWRTFSSFGFLMLLMAIGNRWRRLRRVFRSKRAMGLLVLSTTLLGVNWWVFVYAINQGQVMQASLGYYINPLVSVLLGFLLLRERLSRLQVAAIVIAAAGVLNQVFALGEVPWASLGMGTIFALYGYVRKVVKVEALEGLLIETAMLAPLAIAWVWWVGATGQAVVPQGDILTIALLLFIGILTALPLLFFTESARRLRLSTVGLIQYIAPTMHLAAAIWIWNEALTITHMITFACIWLALAMYSMPSVLAAARAKS